MMIEFWKTMGKFAPLGAIALLLYFGVDLLSNAETSFSTVSFTGAGLIFVGVVLAVLFFADRRKREGYEHLIKQLQGVIKSLGMQIRETSKTSFAIEQGKRDDLSTSNDTLKSEESQYKPDEDVQTSDS